jgi:hypothetical protein
VSALEVGTLGDAGEVGGDAQVGTAWGRTFLTMTAAGFPVLLEVAACPATLDASDPGNGDPPRLDVLAVTWEHTYGKGTTGAEILSGAADPMDSEVTYEWPVDYWPESTRGDDGEPTASALDATARAHIANLPAAWLEGMPAPDHAPDCAVCAAGEFERHAYVAPAVSE